MFVLSSYITIGNYSMKGVHQVVIKKSIHSYVDTAVISLPTSYVLQFAPGQLLPNVSLPQLPAAGSTASVFKEGDPITIQLGYDGQLQDEFEGFVKRVNFGRPCEIECEGFVWLMRNTDFLFTKSWKTTTILEVLQYITAPWPEIKLSPDIQNVSFGPFRITERTGAEVLEDLKKALGFTVYFIGNTIYAGLQYLAQLQSSVSYRLGWNTIDDGQLKFRTQDETRVTVSVDYKDKQGKNHHVIYGKKNGSAKPMQYTIGVVTDENTRRQMANAFARKYRYAGYEGHVSAFLQPYAQHGWKNSLFSKPYPQRNGDYILESTELHFGMQGGRRILEIGRTITPQEELDEQ